ncbi:MAG: hypothetical protein NTW16_08150 [Bacteroidetes bacterium]|nr:hypothetical protein [Bacteroidota bacterium]
MLTNSGRNLEFNLKIIHFVFLFFLLLLPSFGHAQIDIQRYTTATDTFYWKRYIRIPKPPRVNLKRFSVSRSSRTIDTFLEQHLGQFPQFMDDSPGKFSIRDLKKRLYAIDVNGDKHPDVIFSGNSEGESEMVRIWLNRSDSFEFVFEDYQYISKLTKTGNRLVEMQTGDVGSSDSYLYFTRDYRIVEENGECRFIKGKQVVAYQYTEEPMKYYPQPIPFISKADTMLVRASAAQQNEPFIPYLDSFGNIMAKYRKKADGFVLAYKTYGKGEEWFYVEISPSTAPSASILYDMDKMPTFIRGWVSGQSIRLQP